jgi:hypothetical protein
MSSVFPFTGNIAKFQLGAARADSKSNSRSVKSKSQRQKHGRCFLSTGASRLLVGYLGSHPVNCVLEDHP